MKKLLSVVALVLAACTPIFPTPDDFPPPTVIVDFPQVTATPTLELRTRPIMSNDMADARAFFLIIKTQLAAGDDEGFAEKVHYPIQVVVDGKNTWFSESGELAKNLRAILTAPVMDAITQTSEDDLIVLPDGIRVGHGELWFNLYCINPTCADSQFLITQINN